MRTRIHIQYTYYMYTYNIQLCIYFCLSFVLLFSYLRTGLSMLHAANDWKRYVKWSFM